MVDMYMYILLMKDMISDKIRKSPGKGCKLCGKKGRKEERKRERKEKTSKNS